MSELIRSKNEMPNLSTFLGELSDNLLDQMYRKSWFKFTPILRNLSMWIFKLDCLYNTGMQTVYFEFLNDTLHNE